MTRDQHIKCINKLNNAILEALREIAEENSEEVEGKNVDKIFTEWRDEYGHCHINYLLVDLLY